MASAAIYAAAVALMGRNVLATLGTGVAGDVGDPVLNAAILAWSAQHVPWTDAWFQFPGFHPSPDALTFSEHLLGASVIATPLYWVTGNGLVAYNLTLLLGYVLAGVTMFALVHRLTRSRAAAFLSGVAFAFAPYRAAQISHIQTGIVFWAPLALLGLHGYLESAGPPSAEPAPHLPRGGPGPAPHAVWAGFRGRIPAPARLPWLVLFAMAWALQGAANGYFLVFFSVLVGLWVLWFVVARRRWRDLWAITVALLAGALFLAPILVRFISAHAHYGYSRPPEEIAGFGGDIAGVLCAPAGLEVWGWVRSACRPEGELFPGVAIVAICLIGLVAGRRSRAGVQPAPADRSVVAFYAAAALVLWILAWGPEPKLFGDGVLPYGLYSLLQQLPGLDGLRVPARFWMMTALCLSVLAGFAAAAVLRGRRVVLARAIVVLAAVGLLLDGWGAIPAAQVLPPPPNEEVLRGGVVLTLPLGSNRDIDINAQYRAVVGGWKSVNGFSGYEPFHYNRLRIASAEEDPLIFAPFLGRGDLHVVLAPNAGRLVALVERQPGATEVARAGEWRQFHIPRQGRPIPAQPSGERITVASVSASCSPEMLALTGDGDYTTRWQCGPQTPGQEFTADLGRVADVGTIVPALGIFRTDTPRHLVVETSTDGSAWHEAWSGEPRAEALYAEMLAPLEIRMILAFEPRPARYIRLRLTRQDPVFYWSIAELEVWSGDAGRSAAGSSVPPRG